jgi:hypothetical protein
MGMEPFVAADDNAFGHLIGSIPNPTANLQQALAFKVGLDQRRAEVEQEHARAQEVGYKLDRAQMFQRDVAAVGNDPNANAISSLIAKYPEYGEQIKSSWDVKDKAAQAADLTQLGEVYSAAASGNWDLAHRQAQARVDADKAAGRSDPEDEAFLQQIDAATNGDEKARKAVLTTLGTHIAAVSGPEHFASVYGALKGGYTLDAGAARFDEEGNVVAHSPFIKNAEGDLYSWNDVMGGGTPAATPSSGTAAPSSVSPAAADVASSLTASGLPAPVVAGFMGNFHVEGGYDGAQGDGGSATGIGQWRGERATNFEKVIGKPVAQATPAEQAKFVSWEMQHPEQAGMTVAQRDAILAAKSPAQAAALIDQYYERSSGRDRQVRMSAATSFAGGGASHPASGGLKPLLPGKGKPQKMTADEVQAEGLDPNTVYYRDANGVPQAVSGQSGSEQFTLLTHDEKVAAGLDPNTAYQKNTKTGAIAALGGQQRQAKQIPEQVVTKVQPSIDVRDTMARLAGTWNPQYGGHLVLGDSLNSLQRNLGSLSGAPEGMASWWADYQSMDNVVRNQLFGSALTEHEKQAYAATTITPRMAPSEIKRRFNARRAIINSVVARQQNFLKRNGYDSDAVDALYQPLGGSAGGNVEAPSAGGPVNVRSLQEAKKLHSGTTFTLGGKTYKRK